MRLRWANSISTFLRNRRAVRPSHELAIWRAMSRAPAEDIATVATAGGIDAKNLPPGKGDYASGRKIYEAACKACHGQTWTE
jgi:cytochrome c5